MTYQNEEELSQIRAEVSWRNLRGITEKDYLRIDGLISEMKESGMWHNINVLQLPPFKDINIKREVYP